jgi:hypothetical protein
MPIATRFLNSFGRNQLGNMAIMFALTAPVVVGSIGLGSIPGTGISRRANSRQQRTRQPFLQLSRRGVAAVRLMFGLLRRQKRSSRDLIPTQAP